MMVLATYAQASLILVDMVFDDLAWDGSFTYDDTTGQPWALQSAFDVYALSAMDITQAGVATWDLSEVSSTQVPPEYGAVIDDFGRVALFVAAFDTETDILLGMNIGYSLNQDPLRIDDSSTWVDPPGAAYPYEATIMNPVPTPGSFALISLGLACLGIIRRKRTSKS
jgi:hypothetical protein